MNTKTVFNKHLYKEGLRGLKGLAIIALTLLSVLSVVISLSYILNDYAYSSDYSAVNSLNTLTSQYQVLYFLIVILVVPIFTLKTFSFLTTRNGSDFYHSIPHKKQCLLFTFCASIITWLALCIVIPGLLIYTIHSIAAGRLLSLFGLFSVMLHIFVAALLVISTICIACAITGTILTNIITTGIILFLPRLLLYAFRVMLSILANGIIPKNSFFLGTECNLVVQSFLHFTDPNYFLYNYKPLFYSLALSIIYFIIAGILFYRRPSEIAMKPTLGKRLQGFLCILLGTAFSVFPIGLVVSYRLRSYIGTSSPIIFYVVTMYILIIIGMGMYELLTTKRIRNLIHIIPRTLILAVINIGIVGALYVGKHMVYSYTPDKSDIKSVSFEFKTDVDNTFFRYYINSTLLYAYQADITDYYDNSNDDDYLLYKFNDYSTNNEEIKEIIANALNKGVNGGDNYDARINLRTYINTGIRTTTRNINLSYDDFNKIRDLIFADSSFTNNYRNLPSVRKQNLSLSYNYESCKLPKEDLAELYATVIKELSTLNTDDLQTSVFYSNNTWPTLSFAVNNINGYVGSGIVISPTTLPNSYEKFINLVNKNNTPTIAAHVDASSKDTSEFKSYYRMQPMDPNNNFYMSYTMSASHDVYKDADQKALLDTLSSLEGNTIDLSKKDTYLIEIQLNRYSRNKGYDDAHDSSLRFVQIDKETFNNLTKDMAKSE